MKTNRSKNPWQAKIYIDGKQKYCGSFKTEIAAAKRVNSIRKKHGMKLKNPELSEEENFTWPLTPKKVNIFLYIFCNVWLCNLCFFYLFINLPWLQVTVLD